MAVKTMKARYLKPGDRFKYNGYTYILTNCFPSDYFKLEPFIYYVFALNLTTYKIDGISEDYKVELL